MNLESNLILRTYRHLKKRMQIAAFLNRHSQIGEYFKESAEVSNRLRSILPGRSMETGGIFLGHGRIIWSIVRILEPTIVIETGVCNGYSTYLILHALKRNDKGRLYSIDPDNDPRIPKGKHAGG